MRRGNGEGCVSERWKTIDGKEKGEDRYAGRTRKGRK